MYLTRDNAAPHLIRFLLLICVVACGDDNDTASDCEQVGETEACLCADGAEGMRICGEEQTFGQCMECTDQSDGTNATDTDCQDRQFAGQCPPDSVPNLTADPNTACGNADSERSSDEPSRICIEVDGCQLVCDLISSCMCGVDRVSPMSGVICSECAECGNGICEAGEDSNDCAVDCGSECQPDQSRCSSGQLQRCDLRGLWEMPTDCGEGERCVDDGEGSASCAPDGD